jgi:CRP/FNR family transcriptional regulator
MKSLPLVLQKQIKSARIKEIPKGQIIFYEGDSPMEVFIIKEGTVKIYNIDASGNEKILHLISSPAVIPFTFFTGKNKPTQWFYSALTDCDLYLVPREKLQIIVKENPEISVFLMNWFSQEVHELLSRLDSLGKTHVADKLKAALIFLAKRHCIERRSGWSRVIFPVNHQLLADMIGMTRESTTTAMKELADQKIIRNPRLTILEIDMKKLDS